MKTNVHIGVLLILLAWQWIHRGARLDDGRGVTAGLYRQLCDDELAKLGGAGERRLREAAEILAGLAISETFTEFLTLSAGEYL